jgi:hypothetical protein
MTLGRQNLPAVCCGSVLLSLLALSSCDADRSEVGMTVAPRGSAASPATPPEHRYQREDPPPEPLSPCEEARQRAQDEFAAAYALSRPRLVFAAQVTDDATTPATIDRALVENSFAGAFQSFGPGVQVIDAEQAEMIRETDLRLAREYGEGSALLTSLQARNLADLLVVVTVTPDADANGSQRDLLVRQDGDRVEVAVSTSDRDTPPEPLLCTARAVRIDSAQVLATAMTYSEISVRPEWRRIELTQLLDCTAAMIANKLADRWLHDAGGAIGVQLVDVGDERQARRFADWMLEAFPGSEVFSRSFANGAAEMTVVGLPDTEALLERLADAEQALELTLETRERSARRITLQVGEAD